MPDVNVLPRMLYHYTDQAGFLGIAGNQELWATKIQYLNDNREFNLAADIAGDILQDKLKKTSNERIAQTIKDLSLRILKMGKTNICVCSFSEKADLLSQWRGYSRGMAGYCLGFRSAILNGISQSNNFALKKCIYNPAAQRFEIVKVLDMLIDKHMMDEDRNGTYKEGRGLSSFFTPFVRDVDESLSMIFPLIKDASFEEEAEWRLVSKGHVSYDDLHFRPGNSAIIPFTKLNLEGAINNCLTDIIVGHTPNKDLAIASTRDFLHSRMIIASVNSSDIPYRNW
ncbi:hypothetical protein ASE99_24270 [Serratia sp. Leaf51]|nr:hypothetical protein ASE99_24270 [Serratia sp. Leaf51]